MDGLTYLRLACVGLVTFVASLAASDDRQIRWSMTVSDGTIFLTSGDETFETTPEVWAGDPLG